MLSTTQSGLQQVRKLAVSMLLLVSELFRTSYYADSKTKNYLLDFQKLVWLL